MENIALVTIDDCQVCPHSRMDMYPDTKELYIACHLRLKRVDVIRDECDEDIAPVPNWCPLAIKSKNRNTDIDEWYKEVERYMKEMKNL